MAKINWKAGLCGAAAGVANGLFGAGGGMLLVPLLKRNRLLEDRELFASAIAVMLPVSIVSFLIYYFQGAVTLTGAGGYLIGGLVGGLAGGLLYRKVPTKLLHKVLGAFILWGGIRLLL